MHSDRWSYLITRVDSTRFLQALIIASLLFTSQSRAQVAGYGRSSAPIYGGVGISAQPANPFPPLKGTFADSHRTPDGKPCISVAPFARAQIVNPKIIDQIVLVNNVCGQTIRIQICYAKSSDCIVVALEGYQRLERVLGIAAGSTVFRYEYRELF